ncbi:MAG: hypothetical protein JWP63_6202, partial [Candidatus Solibacter sp.]|nr:hypothetical protein [Candidatus Solibacter sp.]
EGFAVLQRGSFTESYAGISYPAVVDIAREMDAEIALVLGTALAHEIGHVLLNSAAHSLSGVMSARMRPQEIAAASRGELRFTPAQAAAIRAAALRRNR